MAQVVLTGQHTGERLTTFEIHGGQVLVIDREYCRQRQAIWDSLQAGAQIVVRLPWSATPLQDEAGQAPDVCQWVQYLMEERGERQVWTQVRKQRVGLRLIAVRLTEEAAMLQAQSRAE